jgi:hypothetical protein
MKYLCYFYGIIRTDINLLKNVIKENKENFLNKNVDYFLITCNPIDNYNYDKQDLIIQLGKEVNIIFIENYCEYLNEILINGTYNQENKFHVEIFNFIKNQNINYDYIIGLRSELLIKINNIDNYFNENTIIPPRYYYNLNPNLLGNNHFYIIPFQTFINLNLSFKNINEIDKISFDCEASFILLFKPNQLIKLDDIIEYNFNGTLKIHIKNNKTIYTNSNKKYLLLQ